MVIPISHNITYEKDTNLDFNDLLSLADTKNVLKYEKKKLIKKEINGLLIATCTKQSYQISINAPTLMVVDDSIRVLLKEMNQLPTKKNACNNDRI